MTYPNPQDLQNELTNLQAQMAQISCGIYPSYPPPNYQMAQSLYPQPAPVQQPLLTRQVDSVHGIKGALEYQSKLAPGSNCIILDDENDIIYFVRKDANGNIPEKLTIGDFKLRKEKYDENSYVTKQDFDEAIDKIMKLVGKDNA